MSVAQPNMLLLHCNFKGEFFLQPFVCLEAPNNEDETVRIPPRGSMYLFRKPFFVENCQICFSPAQQTDKLKM